MHAGGAQPVEEVPHHLGDVGGRGTGVDQDSPIEHADVAGAEAPGIGDEAVHHHAVNTKKIVDGVGVQVGNEVVGRSRVLHLQDVARIPKHPLSVKDSAHRPLIQTVPFNHERGVDRLDPQLAAQRGVRRQGRLRREHADQLSDLHAERIDRIGALKRRFVDHDHPPITATIIPPLAVMMRRHDRRRASSTPCSRIRPARRAPWPSATCDAAPAPHHRFHALGRPTGRGIPAQARPRCPHGRGRVPPALHPPTRRADGPWRAGGISNAYGSAGRTYGPAATRAAWRAQPELRDGECFTARRSAPCGGHWGERPLRV